MRAPHRRAGRRAVRRPRPQPVHAPRRRPGRPPVARGVVDAVRVGARRCRPGGVGGRLASGARHPGRRGLDRRRGRAHPVGPGDRGARPGRHRPGRGRRRPPRRGRLAAVAAAGGPVLPRHVRRRRRSTSTRSPTTSTSAGPSTSTGCAPRWPPCCGATPRCAPASLGDGLPRPVQAIVELGAADVPIDVVDLADVAPAEQPARARRDARRRAVPPLRPAAAAAAARHGGAPRPRPVPDHGVSRHLLLWDGWSGQLVFGELFRLYEGAGDDRAAGAGRPRLVPRLPGLAGRAGRRRRPRRLARAPSPASTSRRSSPPAAGAAEPVLPATPRRRAVRRAQRPAARPRPRATGLTLNTVLSAALGLVLAGPRRPRRRGRSALTVVGPARRGARRRAHRRPVPQHRARPRHASTRAEPALDAAAPGPGRPHRR